jgi:putative chitinase
MKRTAKNWNDILIHMGVKPITAAKWSTIFAEVIGPDTFSAGDSELDDFLGQIAHESGMLERLVENLNYSVDRLMTVWPTRFPTHAGAQLYARNPPALAEKVYGGRLGNDEPGDGARYIGRGLLQVTGKDNYRAVGKVLGLDLLKYPDLLAQPDIALKASIAWWESKIPDAIMGDIVKVTKLVNGGSIGMADRIALTNEAREVLG